MVDRYEGASDDLDGPASKLLAVTPSDSAPLAYASKALYIGGTGDVTLIGVGDTAAVTLKAVTVGSVLRIRARQVMATGTTASNIVAFI